MCLMRNLCISLELSEEGDYRPEILRFLSGFIIFTRRCTGCNAPMADLRWIGKLGGGEERLDIGRWFLSMWG